MTTETIKVFTGMKRLYLADKFAKDITFGEWLLISKNAELLGHMMAAAVKQNDDMFDLTDKNRKDVLAAYGKMPKTQLFVTAKPKGENPEFESCNIDEIVKDVMANYTNNNPLLDIYKQGFDAAIEAVRKGMTDTDSPYNLNAYVEKHIASAGLVSRSAVIKLIEDVSNPNDLAAKELIERIKQLK